MTRLMIVQGCQLTEDQNRNKEFTTAQETNRLVGAGVFGLVLIIFFFYRFL